MEIKTPNRVIDVARLHSLTNVSKITSVPYPSLYLKKLRGELETVVISGIEFIVEPEDNFKSITRKKSKKKGVTV